MMAALVARDSSMLKYLVDRSLPACQRNRTFDPKLVEPKCDGLPGERSPC